MLNALSLKAMERLRRHPFDTAPFDNAQGCQDMPAGANIISSSGKSCRSCQIALKLGTWNLKH